MQFSAKDMSPDFAYRLLSSTIIPRPIAFVTTLSDDGVRNGAPFSFFNAMASDPPTVVIGVQAGEGGMLKDTAANILASKEFCISLIDEPLADQMNQCAVRAAPHVDELELAGLETLPCAQIAPPRLACAPVSYECGLSHEIALSGGAHILIGQVVHFHVKDEMVASRDPLRVDMEKFAPIARLSGPYYARIADRFELKRPK